MAALSKRADAPVERPEQLPGAQFRPVEAVAGTTVLAVSPPAALQARIVDAFAAPPSASGMQVAGKVVAVAFATWLAGVMLYASL